ncbi:MAG TPA: hypothetical protein VNS32_22465 [Flavisolibacter sp.]|nr:hypothetical protein [Flavisolibacter sp.]
MYKRLLALCLLIALCFQSCLKDSCRNTYTIYRPIYKNLSQIRSEMKSEAPKPLSATGKIYVYGNYIFLNEAYTGIHIIDNANPASPKNIGFIPIPGNVDMAVKGNYLYADCFSDIAVFNISDPAHIKPERFLNNVIKENGYYWGNSTNPDSVMILAGYTKKDTTVDCETYNRWRNCANCGIFYSANAVFLTAAPNSSGQTGQAGSMARFGIVNNYLYGVSYSKLYSFDITDPSQPRAVSDITVNNGIETMYPFKDKLFLGSTNGMFVYDLSNPASPSSLGQFSHVRSCDPVITDGQYAYVTLRSGTACQGFTNQLDVLDVSSLSSPTMVKTYSMTNPHGLSKDGDLLFICDGKDGLKVYDARKKEDLKLIKTLDGMETYDVITLGRTAIVVAKDGLYEFDYSDKGNIHQVSKISISKSSL